MLFPLFKVGNVEGHRVSNYKLVDNFFSIGTIWPAQLSLSILSRKVLKSAVASGTSNHQLGGEPGI
jgi:hypothetical protein